MPDPKSEWPATRQSDGTKVAKLGKQKQRYSTSAETRAAFFTLLPIILFVGFIARIAEGSR
jgi:hypothetical protein